MENVTGQADDPYQERNKWLHIKTIPEKWNKEDIFSRVQLPFSYVN